MTTEQQELSRLAHQKEPSLCRSLARSKRWADWVKAKAAKYWTCPYCTAHNSLNREECVRCHARISRA